MPAFSELDTFYNEPVLDDPCMHREWVPKRSFGGAKVYEQTYLYICCNCKDGPKTHNMQPVCVMCNHRACSGCEYVK